MICRRLEGQEWPHGLSYMWKRYVDGDARGRWYFGLFLRIGQRLFGFRYRSFSFPIFFFGEQVQ